MGFSIFDILREAEGDDNAQDTPATNDAVAPAEAPAEGDNPDAGDDNNDNDDFDIDANLDDDQGGDDTEGGDDLGGGDDMGDTESTGGTDDSEDEPVEANTDIFASLTAEEQQMKIMELKNQYNNLHRSCDDILEKISCLQTDENSSEFIAKITSSLFSLKHYIADYLVYIFADKSFVENDIMFNRFLSIIQSISLTLEKFEKKINKDRPKSDDNIQK